MIWKYSIIAALFISTIAFPLRESMTYLIEGRDTGLVKFYLYTKNNPTSPQQLFLNNEDSITKSNFDASRQTKILIHGWGGSYTSSPNPSIRNAYLAKGHYNIISIDWHAYSKLNYISARAKVPVVGEDIAEMIDYLNQKFGLSFEKLIVIGHSLGAHVAGFTGKNVKLGKIVGIVGLDAAMPLYNINNLETRLASTDAKYVQTIHTNGGLKGFLNPIGSVSFYANWGRSQPGCGTDIDGSCAHGRSVSYYAEAVRGYSYAPVSKCSSYQNIVDKNGCNTVYSNVEIGDPLEINRVNGIFHFKTNDKSPFGHLSNRYVYF